jgi:SAM-dependent methyltransferase
LLVIVLLIVQPNRTHYQREKDYWDVKGAHDYATLSVPDRQRIVDWIGWQGHGRVLDIGGGAGMVSRLLAAVPQTHVVCLDISALMLRHSPVPVIQADALQLPVASESFALIVAAAFLHHLPSEEGALLAECHRALVSGGRLVGYDPNGKSLQNRIFMGGGPLRLKRFTPDERPVVPINLEREVARASFSSFEYEYFTFRNETKTAFETVQSYLINPISKGPLKRYLDRWFFWRAEK